LEETQKNREHGLQKQEETKMLASTQDELKGNFD